MDRQAQRDIRRKLNCLQFAQECGSVVLTCRKFGVAKSSFYRWKALYKEKGEAGLRQIAIEGIKFTWTILRCQPSRQFCCPLYVVRAFGTV